MTGKNCKASGKYWLALPLLFLLISCGQSPTLPIDRQFSAQPVLGDWLYSVTPNIQSFCFYLYIPDDYTTTQSSYPLILFLQGWGHFGSVPNPALLSAGPLLPIYVSDTQLDPGGLEKLDTKIRHSIIVIPMMPFYDQTYQNPLGWYNPETIDRIIEYVMALYRVDHERFYITGLSEGGGGAWGYALNYPAKITAIIPISCGLSWPATDALKTKPTWIFQSYDDTVCPHQTCSDAAFDAVTGVQDVLDSYPHMNGDPSKPATDDLTISYSNSSGLSSWNPGTVYPTGRTTYTLYASGGHDAWTRTYANPDVWTWLYAQSN